MLGIMMCPGGTLAWHDWSAGYNKGRKKEHSEGWGMRQAATITATTFICQALSKAVRNNTETLSNLCHITHLGGGCCWWSQNLTQVWCSVRIRILLQVSHQASKDWIDPIYAWDTFLDNTHVFLTSLWFFWGMKIFFYLSLSTSHLRECSEWSHRLRNYCSFSPFASLSCFKHCPSKGYNFL